MVSALLLSSPARRLESGLSTVEAKTSVRLAAPLTARKKRRRTCPITTTASPVATAGAARPEPGIRNTRCPAGEFGGDLVSDQFVAGGGSDA